mmetsp:Transcript_19140/g.28500  ORF Transcript_19140/g.28500 Transcript_19140/m.28500 type:complete len:334 (+) Transcript_19140:193-1194(+)
MTKRGLSMQQSTIIFLWDQYAAFKIFFTCLMSLESILGTALCIFLTVYMDKYWVSDDNLSIDWVLLSLAVILPMSLSIRAAFERREKGLRFISKLRSSVFQLYLAHATWNFGGGSDVDVSGFERLDHSDEVINLLMDILCDLSRLLNLPCVTRARHRMSSVGKKEAKKVNDVSKGLYYASRAEKMQQLTMKAEVLKSYNLGLPEGIRIRQWERFMCEAMDELHNLKQYRTPQAMRSFARIFSFVLPALYSPVFAQLAADTSSLGLAIIFATIVSLALSTFFNSIYYLEDPFVSSLPIALDNIDAVQELKILSEQQFIATRGALFPSADPFERT